MINPGQLIYDGDSVWIVDDTRFQVPVGTILASITPPH